ncbi:PAS domain-containing protein [Rhodobacter sp. JA431]|uniref:PAS domain-containing protein n=1 Tax=Rhodobacter sp. JA431 TaxID=570013 RepID=UPI0020165129|nr:PAS domain-containing protein [Rhodobacter sp. JA431]
MFKTRRTPDGDGAQTGVDTMDRDFDIQDKVARLGDTGVSRRVVAQMRAYWEGLRKGRDVPARAEIDPRGLESALEYAFILERVAPGMGRFRLAGMHLNDLMGMEVRGMPLTALFTPEGRKRVADATEAVFSGPSVAELVLTAEAGIGKPAMTARLILLPMKSDMGDVTRILGCLVAEGAGIGRTPRRFVVDAVHVEPVKQGQPTPAKMPSPVRPEAFGLGARLPKFGADAPKPATAPQPFTAVKPARPAFAARTPEERRAMFRVVTND